MKLNTVTGRMSVNAVVVRSQCIELLFQPPPRGCWCNKDNDWTIRSCSKCGRQSHFECIIPRRVRPKSAKSWDGRGCQHCVNIARENENNANSD